MKRVNDFNKKVGNKIKKARDEMGMSQPDLAKVLGYDSATAISLIEVGKMGLKMEDLVVLSKHFKKPYEYFLDNSTTKNENKSQDEIIEDLARRLIRLSRNKKR